MCLSVRWSFLVCLSPVPLSLSLLLALHCLPVLWPAQLLPQCRIRRGLNPVRTRTMRSIAPWRCTTLSQFAAHSGADDRCDRNLSNRRRGSAAFSSAVSGWHEPNFTNFCEHSWIGKDCVFVWDWKKVCTVRWWEVKRRSPHRSRFGRGWTASRMCFLLKGWEVLSNWFGTYLSQKIFEPSTFQHWWRLLGSVKPRRFRLKSHVKQEVAQFAHRVVRQDISAQVHHLDVGGQSAIQCQNCSLYRLWAQRLSRWRRNIFDVYRGRRWWRS